MKDGEKIFFASLFLMDKTTTSQTFKDGAKYHLKSKAWNGLYPTSFNNAPRLTNEHIFFHSFFPPIKWRMLHKLG
jgi:hypothetical protein